MEVCNGFTREASSTWVKWSPTTTPPCYACAEGTQFHGYSCSGGSIAKSCNALYMVCSMVMTSTSLAWISGTRWGSGACGEGTKMCKWGQGHRWCVHCSLPGVLSLYCSRYWLSDSIEWEIGKSAPVESLLQHHREDNGHYFLKFYVKTNGGRVDKTVSDTSHHHWIL